MNTNAVILSVLILFITSSCKTGIKDSGDSADKVPLKHRSADQPKVIRDWAEIEDQGVLRVLISYSSTSYFIYKGQPMGYEFELIREMAKDLGLSVELVIVNNLDSMIDKLIYGEGDIIAHNLTITKERAEKLAYTKPHNITQQVLVQRKPENWRQMKLHEIDETLINTPIGLIGKKIHVKKNTAYASRLRNLSEELGEDLNIIEIEKDIATEELIRQVSEGEIDYTVADEDIARINQTYYTNLDCETQISLAQRNAWAVRKSSEDLLEKVNEWIEEKQNETWYYVVYNKYFKNTKAFRTRQKSEAFSLRTGQISRYDDLFKSHAQKINWDWRLLASQAYQESQFDPRAESWAGARGLMQVLPKTAGEYGITKLRNPENGIKAGILHLEELIDFWAHIPDSTEKVKFVLASYNVGQYHVEDARRLARKYESNPDSWQEVEEFLLKKMQPEFYSDPVVKFGYCRGTEPVAYVEEILNRYNLYRRTVPLISQK